MSWWHDPWLLFDTETTGVDPATARIWELGLLRTSVVGKDAARSVFAYPDGPIPDEVADLCGITGEDRVAIAAGLPFSRGAYVHLVDGIRTIGGPGVLIAYNGIDYDIPVIQAECDRGGLPNPITGHRILDPVVFIRHFHRGWQKRALGDAAARFGFVPPDGLHRAVADCCATRAVVRGLQSEMPASWDDLQRLQTSARAHQQMDFSRFSYWIYTDAVTGQVHMGAGKHCGTPLDRVPASYLDWILSKERAWDTPLTEETRLLFSDQKKRGVR